MLGGKQKGIFLIATIFWILVGVFIVTASMIAIPVFRKHISFPIMAISGAILFLLGIALMIITIKAKIEGILKSFLILTGASSIGIFVSIFLHNAIYGLLIYFLGADIWERLGVTDEPFFFIMAIFVCPTGFLVGVVGSIVILIKKIMRKQENRH